MSQPYVCPLGCVIQVANKHDIGVHNGKHLSNIQILLHYHLDLVAPGRAVLYQNILAMIQEGMQKVPDPLPKDF